MEEELRSLQEEISRCTKCPLHLSRTHVVFGDGEGPFVMVGEAPGRNEDLQGKPFVGQAGRVLNELLEKSGMERRRFFITNVVKCRPPGNRNPTWDEIRSCKPYLDRQIEIISPPAIIALGRFSATVLLGMERLITLKEYRGRVLDSIYGIPLVITYHPASVLRNPSLYDRILQDFTLFRERFYRNFTSR